MQSTSLVARFGHESGFSADGKRAPRCNRSRRSTSPIRGSRKAIWQGNVYSHGISLSDDGNRAYIADPKGDMPILETSEIQARKPHPQVREISRLTWASVSIPQNAIPFTEHGKPYVLEFDEYNQGTLAGVSGYTSALAADRP